MKCKHMYEEWISEKVESYHFLCECGKDNDITDIVNEIIRHLEKQQLSKELLNQIEEKSKLEKQQQQGEKK